MNYDKLLETKVDCSKTGCQAKPTISEINSYNNGKQKIKMHWCDYHWLVHQQEIYSCEINQPEIQIIERYSPKPISPFSKYPLVETRTGDYVQGK